MKGLRYDNVYAHKESQTKKPKNTPPKNPEEMKIIIFLMFL